jgi:hypothetical protein
MADLSNLGLGTENPFLGAGNPYLQSIIDMSSKDMVDNWNRTQLPAYNAAMLKSGSFGNSGIDEMTRAGQDQLQGNLGDLASKLRFNDYGQQQGMYQWQKNFDEGSRRYEQDFDRGVFNDSYGQNRQNMMDGLGLLSVLGGFNASDINNSTTQQDAPLNYFQRFAGIAQGLGGMGGPGTSTTGTSSNPLASALGGAALGSKWGSSSGSSSGGWDWGGVDSTGYNSGTGTWFA